jgi:hypothetical protein
MLPSARDIHQCLSGVDEAPECMDGRASAGSDDNVSSSCPSKKGLHPFRRHPAAQTPIAER